MDVTSSSSIGIVHDSSGVKIGSIRDDAFVARHWNLSSPIFYLADTACLSKEAYLYVKGMFAEIHQKVRERNSNDGIVARDHNKEGKMACDEVRFKNPRRVTKGLGKRLRSSEKKAQSKPRLCNGCHKRGVSHDKRNCPALLKRCTRGDKNESPTDTSSDSDTSDTSTSDDERTSLMLPQSKPRLCNGCNKRGVSHDKRNCPALLKRCTRGDKNESPTDPTSDSDTSDTSTSDDEGSQETSLMLQQSKPRLCNGCNRRGVSHDKRNCPALLKRCTREDKNESPTDTSSDSDTSDTSTSDDERTSLMLPQSKPRLCNGCNKRGVSHDKRNCPGLLNRCTREDENESPTDATSKA
eukprot:TRINITY_DN7958_c0_g1_i1.p1 TRINITY_DN7958_c0_g1~~TRINITY_DN7958_c0_g1_i1.p1  ORF type:complete len:353 (+),score=62.33 TRINITY_DN7958_c0_g1_i1:113-1171(+)